MRRHTISGIFFFLSLILVMFGCKGKSGIEEVKAEESQKEEWHMTDDLAKVQVDPAMEEAFRDAAFEGELENVKALQNKGVDCNATDQEGHTALMFAAFNGHSDVLHYLIENGAVVDQRDMMDRTALLYGATGPFPETVKILLDKGANPNALDSNEHFSPLMHAAAEGHLEVVKLLLKYGADRSLKDIDGDDASSFALQAGHMHVVEYLKQAE
jgi:uncharacterized protein